MYGKSKKVLVFFLKAVIEASL